MGGLGLNLTGADTVIFLEHDWNPMKDLQVHPPQSTNSAAPEHPKLSRSVLSTSGGPKHPEYP